MLQEQYYYRDGDLAVRMASWDSGFSARRRTWGRELKAFDLDQIVGRNPYGEPGGLGMMETWNFAVRALVEYKHERGIHVDWGRYEAQWSRTGSSLMASRYQRSVASTGAWTTQCTWFRSTGWQRT